jgi:tRNA modification GTPase
VLDVVRARSNAGLELALEQLTGWLSQQIEPLRQKLVGLLAHLEALVDFVEDDIPPQLDDAMRGELEASLAAIEQLLAGAEQGIILREGTTLAILGSPNVGKSSIMNALLGLERSIVTPIPGTTRDTVEETLQVRGLAFRTIDTAGITSTDNLVEQIGVERSRRAAARADVILLVLDRSRPWSDEDEMVSDLVLTTRADNSHDRRQRLVLVTNKCDLPSELEVGPIVDRIQPRVVIACSALTLDGFEELRAAIEDAALGGTRHEHVVGNVRHSDALRRAAGALRTALAGHLERTPLDLVSFDVRVAAEALGEITGACVDDELLDRIFRDFCVGK